MQQLDPRTSQRRGFALVTTPSLVSKGFEAQADPKEQLSKRRKADASDTRRMAAWRDTGDLVKMSCMTRACDQGCPSPLAFSLNLSRDVQVKAMATPMKAKTFLRDRLTKAFARRLSFPVEFAFVVEFTESGRLHLHGILLVDQRWRREATQALMDAGGKWDAKHPEFQADMRHLWNGDGWASYCAKSASRTKRILGVKSVLSCTRPLQQRAQAYWENLRALEKAELSVQQ